MCIGGDADFRSAAEVFNVCVCKAVQIQVVPLVIGNTGVTADGDGFAGLTDAAANACMVLDCAILVILGNSCAAGNGGVVESEVLGAVDVAASDGSAAGNGSATAGSGK